MKWQAPLLSMLFVLTACGTQSSALRQEDSQATRAALINVQLGAGYMGQGKNELALSKLKRALEEDSSLPSAHYTIAVLYSRLGEVELADEHFRKAVSLAPDDPEAHNNYGTFLCAQNKLKEADAQFLAALKNPLYKTPEFAYTNAGVCALRMPDAARAERYFRQALQANPQFPEALYQMAEMNFTQHRYLQARAYLQRHLEAAQQSAASLWLGVRIERAMGDRTAAADYAKRLQTNFPDSRETSLLLDAGQHGQSTGQ